MSFTDQIAFNLASGLLLVAVITIFYICGKIALDVWR